MSYTSSGGRGADQTRPAIMLPRVSYCHDCCCGTLRKHPDVDHDALRAQLRTALKFSAVVTQSACLDACEESNVVVVSPSPLVRRKGSKPVWLRRMLTPELIDELTAWVEAGGPGLAPPPPAIRRQQMKRPG